MPRVITFLVLSTLVLSTLVFPACGGKAGDGGGVGTGGEAGSTGNGGQVGTGCGATGGVAGMTGGGTCEYGGMIYVVGSHFPSGDGCNTCICTTFCGTPYVTCTLIGCGGDCQFDTTYVFGEIGGHVAFEDAVTLTPPANYQHRRRATGGTPADVTCAPPLPACLYANAFKVPDVLRDVADADVQQALALATPPIYGNDSRPIDGSIFSFMRADGRGFLAGGACSGGGTCVDVPAGVARLVTDLRALDQQQLKDATCAQLR